MPCGGRPYRVTVISGGHTWWREDRRRVDPLQLAVPQALCHTVGALFHTSGTLVPPHGVEGTSTQLHGHERAGDGVSPVARHRRRSARSRRKNAWGVPAAPEVVDPAAVDPPGSPMKWVGEQVAGQGGWYRGAGCGHAALRTSSLRQSTTTTKDPSEQLPPRPPAGGPARPRARGPRVLAGTRHLREVRGAQRGRPRPRHVDLLRGPADRQRPAGHPPHRVADVQGRLPAVPDHAGLPGQPQGRLGLPRPAGRARRGEGARLLRQGRHRGLRHRRVQRPLPRVGAAPRGPVGADDRPDGVLDRHARALPDDGPGVRRVGLVGAEADPRQGTAGRGLPGGAVLPPLRHRPLRPRARPGLRDGHRPVGLRPASRSPPARTPAGPACSSGRRRPGPWCPTRSSPYIPR